MSARYFTTTLPYVNSDPHIGFALEIVQADTLARAARLKGDEVFFSTGTDEHGQKIFDAAAKAGEDPQAYTDRYAAEFKKLKETLNLSNDAFVRTTDAGHVAAAQAFWKKCAAAGDIYKAVYQVKYCVGCELEKTDSELDHGKCPLHPNLEIEIREEENYYFKFSKYQDSLLKFYTDRPDFVVPASRLNEIQTFVQAGLKDFSISRKRDKLAWGVPVPGDEAHVMYVWFDALVNYISVLGWPADESNFKKWWPGTQLAGKDNLRQQAAMWQAMLLSAGLPFSKQIFIHGFITSGGQKMSKSLGNVINPFDLVAKYGIDAVRYVLLRHTSPFEDSDLTLEAINEHYTAHLTNGLGNLVARVMKLAQDNLPAPVALSVEDTTVEQTFYDLVDQFKFNEAMNLVFEHVAKGDAFITEHAPYKKVGSTDATEVAEGKAEIEKLVRHVAKVAAHLVPVMPQTAEKILAAVRENKKPENLFPRIA